MIRRFFVLIVFFLLVAGYVQQTLPLSHAQGNMQAITAGAGPRQPESSANTDQQRQEWLWRSRMTPGANLFRLRQKAYKQIKAMRAAVAALASNPFAVGWQPFGSAATSFFGTRSAGATVGMAIDPTNSQVVYTGSAGGGVWKTADAGSSWTPLTDQQAFTEDGSFVMDPNNPNVLYVGPSGGYAGGILKSSDGGSTWSLITGPFVGPFGPDNIFGGSTPIPAMAVQPSNSSVMLVATVGAKVGMFRTADGGNTWNQVVNGLPFFDILFDPNNPATVYASGCPAAANLNPGVYKSGDAGLTWTRLSGGLPTAAGTAGLSCRLGMSPSNPLALAVIFSGAQNTFITSDGGNTWSQVTSPPDYPHNAGIFFSRTDPNILFDGSAGFFRSSDGGQTWQDISVGANAVSIHPDQGGHAWVGNTNQLYIGNDGGVFYTPDATASGVNWTNLNNGLATLRLYPGLGLHPSDSTITLAGTQDEGTLLSNSASGWTSVGGCGDSAYTAIDQQNPSNMYANCFGVQIEKSTNGGASFSGAITGINTSDPVNFFPPLVIDPSDGLNLYFGTNHVYQTIDGAQTWNAISPAFNNLVSISVSPKDSNTVYAAEALKVWTSSNVLSGPATWAGSISGLPPRGKRRCGPPKRPGCLPRGLRIFRLRRQPGACLQNDRRRRYLG